MLKNNRPVALLEEIRYLHIRIFYPKIELTLPYSFKSFGTYDSVQVIFFHFNNFYKKF